MPVSNVHILNIGSSAYDLRKISSWSIDGGDATVVNVRFMDNDISIRLGITLTAFEAAKQASLDSVTYSSG